MRNRRRARDDDRDARATSRGLRSGPRLRYWSRARGLWGSSCTFRPTVQGVARVADCLVITADRPQGTHRFEADMVVHGAGRVPAIDDSIWNGVACYGKRGVRVNEYLQSISNPAVYAAGDAADSGPMLTPVADHEGRIVATNLFEGNTPDRVPARAERRLHSAAARLRGTSGSRGPGAGTALHDELRANRRLVPITTSRWRCSAHKVLVEEESGRIIGAHLLGPNSEGSLTCSRGHAVRHARRRSEGADLRLPNTRIRPGLYGLITQPDTAHGGTRVTGLNVRRADGHRAGGTRGEWPRRPGAPRASLSVCGADGSHGVANGAGARIENISQ